MLSFDSVFEADNYRTEYANLSRPKKHYAFIVCDECDQLRKAVFPAKYQQRHNRHFWFVNARPAYWLEVSNWGDDRACFGLVAVNVAAWGTSIKAESNGRVGGGKRSVFANTNPLEMELTETNPHTIKITGDLKILTRMVEHFRSHMNPQELDKMAMNHGYIPTGTEGFSYESPRRRIPKPDDLMEIAEEEHLNR